MKYEYIRSMEKIRKKIKKCSDSHIQQVAFSVHHDALTQICFGCGVVRSNILKEYVLSDTKKEKRNEERNRFI